MLKQEATRNVAASIPHVVPWRGVAIDNLILRHVSRGSNEIYARFPNWPTFSLPMCVCVCVLTQLATCRSIFQRVSWLTFFLFLLLAPFTV